MFGFIPPPSSNNDINISTQKEPPAGPLWKWDTSTNVREKKCDGCKKSMWTDIHHAVEYKGATWHLHCLLDSLTLKEYNNSSTGSSGNLFDSAYHGAP